MRTPLRTPPLGLVMQVQAREAFCDGLCIGRCKRELAVAIRCAADGSTPWTPRCEAGAISCEESPETFVVHRIPALTTEAA